MAVDSKSKRYSMLSFAGGDLLFMPDGTVNDDDRFAMLELYVAFERQTWYPATRKLRLGLDLGI